MLIVQQKNVQHHRSTRCDVCVRIIILRIKGEREYTQEKKDEKRNKIDNTRLDHRVLDVQILSRVAVKYT